MRTQLIIYRLDKPSKVWPLFAPHHYLSGTLNPSARCWIGVLDDHPIAFSSSITLPSGTLRNAWREHRTVVLPDYQGLGLGLRMSEWVGEYHIRMITDPENPTRFYSRTTHPKVGEARDRSDLWRATKKSMKPRNVEWSHAKSNPDSGKQGKGRWNSDSSRIAYSHEYIGDPAARASTEPWIPHPLISGRLF